MPKLNSRRKFLSKEALSLMGIPVMYQGITWNNYRFPNSKMEHLLRGYTSHCDEMLRDCVGLLFLGQNGNGKTYISSIILQYCYSYYHTCRMSTFKDLISMAFNKEDSYMEFLNSEFLVIDELGAEVSLKSDAEKSLLEGILKYRFTKGYPTILCSNLDLGQLKERYGNTFYSMLSEFIKVTLLGEDGRKQAFSAKKALEYLR